MVSHNHTAGGKWSRTYVAWANMVKRCRPGHPRHKDYFDRGIAVCARWAHFELFLIDMGKAPKGLTLDRKNNNKGYNKQNCRWATYVQQNRNKNYLTFRGVTKPMREWEKAIGFTRSGTIARRLALGWSLTRALTEPRNNTGKR